MNTFKNLGIGASLSAFMALAAPASASSLLASESLDQGYAQHGTQVSQPDDDKKKKDKEKDKEKHGGADKKEKDKEKHCGADKKGDKDKNCGEGSCG